MFHNVIEAKRLDGNGDGDGGSRGYIEEQH